MATRITSFKKMARDLAEDLNRRYKGDHPEARIDTYSVPYGVRLRVVDPDFATLDGQERRDRVWAYLKDSPKEIRQGLSATLFISPEERDMTFLSLEFDDPARRLL